MWKIPYILRHKIFFTNIAFIFIYRMTEYLSTELKIQLSTPTYSCKFIYRIENTDLFTNLGIEIHLHNKRCRLHYKVIKNLLMVTNTISVLRLTNKYFHRLWYYTFHHKYIYTNFSTARQNFFKKIEMQTSWQSWKNALILKYNFLWIAHGPEQTTLMKMSYHLKMKMKMVPPGVQLSVELIEAMRMKGLAQSHNIMS